MPRIPKLKTIQPTATSAGIINAVLVKESGYLAGAPLAKDTVDSIRQAGNWIVANQQRQNQFLTALVNRIALVIVSSSLYENPWKFLKKGMVENGETIEEIYVNLVKAEDFYSGEHPVNTLLSDLFKQRIPDVQSAFHAMNFQKKYPVTVSYDQLNQAFNTREGVLDLVQRIIETLTTSMEADEYSVMKYLLFRTALDGKIKAVTVADPTASEANAKAAIKTIKNISDEMQYLKASRNIAKVPTHTKKEDQYVFLTIGVGNTLDVDVLASAFNVDRVQFAGRHVPIDSFETYELDRLGELLGDTPGYKAFTDEEIALLNSIVAIIVDKDFFMIFDNLYRMTDTGLMANTLSTTYFLHKWSTFSISPFKNAELLTTSVAAINSVTVTPAKVTLSGANVLNLSATVNAAGFISQDVKWSSNDPNVLVSSFGTVTVREGVGQGHKITITATSIANPEVSGTCTITIA